MIQRGLFLAIILLLALPAWPGQAGPEAANGSRATGWIADPLAVPDLERAYRFDHPPAALARSWERSLIFVPGEAFGRFTFGLLGSDRVRERLAALPSGRRYPLVIVLDYRADAAGGETGLLEEFEVENLAALFLPDVAPRGRAGDCSDAGCVLSPEIYLARRAEMIHAVNRARRLPWVDRDKVFLVGVGEGGAVVALWGGEVSVKAYAVANWTCTAPAEARWFDGLRTPAERPVLLINSRATLWSGRDGWDGACTERANGHSGARVVSVGSSVKNAFTLPSGRRALIAFLQEQRLR